MALISNTITTGFSGNGRSRSKSVVATGTSVQETSCVVPGGVTAWPVTGEFLAADLQSVYADTDQDITLDANGTDSIPIAAGGALGWATGSGLDSPITVDVTAPTVHNRTTLPVLSATPTAILAAGASNRTVSADAQPTGGARKIVATPGGTAANVLAVSVTITGLDENGKPQVEILPAFTAGSAAAKTGSKYFSAISTSGIAIPSAGSAVTVAIGQAAKTGTDANVNIEFLI